MSRKLRLAVPNGITFISLSCGVISIMLSTKSLLLPAGILILASYLLDSVDGSIARKLGASTEFGLQLDSLVDMVSLGTAPAILVFVHLNDKGLHPGWIWPFAILLPLAGAFRLARFNLLPPKKTSSGDSVGMTITDGGAAIALTVLADLSWDSHFIPAYLFVIFLVLFSSLMVSRIAFPSMMWALANRWITVSLLLLIGISIWQFNFFTTWFFWSMGYFTIALLLEIRRQIRNRI